MMASKHKDDVLPIWQSNLINQIVNYIKHFYCLPDKFNEDQFREYLQKKLLQLNTETPEYKTLDQIKLDPASNPVPAAKIAFVSAINNVLKEFDGHLRIFYDPVKIATEQRKGNIILDDKTGTAHFPEEGPDKETLSAILEETKQEGYGLSDKPLARASHVPRDIGYLKIKYFMDPRLDEDEKEHKMGSIRKKAYESMQKLQGKRAIIIDLRDSFGGSPEMVEYLISFLLKETGMKINNIYNRATHSTREYKVLPHDFKLLNVPVYVLVNKSTFSASEEFAYDLQQINQHVLKDNRFVIVGQNTRGGAHPGGTFPLRDPKSGQINDEYLLWLSTENAVNPYSHTNWEDQPGIKGVQPDVKLAENEDALDYAERRIRSTLARARLSMFSHQEKSKLDDADITLDEMVHSDFGQGSHTAKKIA